MFKIFVGLAIIISTIIGKFEGNLSGDAIQICLSLGAALVAVGLDSQCSKKFSNKKS